MMNLENIMLSGKKPDTKGYMFYNSNDVQCPEQADTYRQKTDRWLPGPGGGERNGSVFFRVMTMS